MLRPGVGLLLMSRPLRRAQDADLLAIRALLAAHGLPVADLHNPAIEFLVAADDTRLHGVIGLDRFDDAGLLRSLCVQGDLRGSGLGVARVEAVESQARDAGLRQLVLLTQTAAPFFSRRGYAPIERSAAPAGVQRSAEFASICPASATCMAKPL